MILQPEIPGPGQEDYIDHAARAATPPPLVVNVEGTPIPQGSKTVVPARGKRRATLRDANAHELHAWRDHVADTTRRHMDTYWHHGNRGWTQLDGPCHVEITFYHPRPQNHYRTSRGRPTRQIKPNAPTWKPTSPDLDKLARAILDALTAAGAYRDDARVARLILEDRYADGPTTGARIILAPLPQPQDGE